MGRKTVCRLVGAAMLLFAALFIVFAFQNPQASFPWSNEVTYGIYFVYLVVMVLLLASPFGSRRQ